MKDPRTVALVTGQRGDRPLVLALMDDGTIWQAVFDSGIRAIAGWSPVPPPGREPSVGKG